MVKHNKKNKETNFYATVVSLCEARVLDSKESRLFYLIR
jgi:hypothetical protein